MLNPSDFEANPIAGAPIAAAITGTGATLSPDAVATGTGTQTGLASATTLASLGITSGETITVNDGTNTTTYTSTGSDTVADLISAINGGSAKVTASLNGSGDLVLTGNDRHRVDHGRRHRPRPLSASAPAQNCVPADQSADAKRGVAGPDPDRHGRQRRAADDHVRHRRRPGRDAGAIADRDPGPDRRERLRRTPRMATSR